MKQKSRQSRRLKNLKGMRKIIYTAIFGNYDNLRPPKVENPGWEHICYTDNPNLYYEHKFEEVRDVWDVRVVDSKEFGAVKTARNIKICPPMDYDICIWVDGCFEIKTDLDKFVETYHNGVFTLSDHGRNCIYREGEVCAHIKKDSEEVINAQMQRYRKEGYPEANGMVATGMMVRNNRKDVQELCDFWWSEVLKGSKRDQLSFNYALWKYYVDVRIISFKDMIDNHFSWLAHRSK